MYNGLHVHYTSILYEKVKLLSNQGSSPEEIHEDLGIDEEEVKEILVLCKKEDEKRQKNDKNIKKAEDRKQKRKQDIERKARKAIDDYEYKDKNIKNVRVYINECKNDFKDRKFAKKDLDFLMECMIFVQCNCEEIELFSRICVSFKEFKRASSFIIENIDNEDVKPEEKILMILSKRNKR